MKMNHIYTMQAKMDLIGVDMPQKYTAGSWCMAGYVNDFKNFIEETDWDRRLLRKYGKAADLFCWGVVVASVLFFFQVGLATIFN